MVRVHVIFTGEVQNVGFRYTIKMMAERFQLTGSVRNCLDGSVEAFLQGECEDIDTLLSSVSDPQRFFDIRNMDISQCPVDYYEHFFRIIYE